jgi:hypothetical protein
MSTSLERV